MAIDGISDYSVGVKTGEMIARYIKGENIEDMPYEKVEFSEIFINNKKIKELGITIPEEIKNYTLIKE